MDPETPDITGYSTEYQRVRALLAGFDYRPSLEEVAEWLGSDDPHLISMGLQAGHQHLLQSLLAGFSSFNSRINDAENEFIKLLERNVAGLIEKKRDASETLSGNELERLWFDAAKLASDQIMALDRAWPPQVIKRHLMESASQVQQPYQGLAMVEARELKQELRAAVSRAVLTISGRARDDNRRRVVALEGERILQQLDGGSGVAPKTPADVSLREEFFDSIRSDLEARYGATILRDIISLPGARSTSHIQQFRSLNSPIPEIFTHSKEERDVKSLIANTNWRKSKSGGVWLKVTEVESDRVSYWPINVPYSSDVDARTASSQAEWPSVRLGEYVTKIGSGSTPRGGEAVYVKKGVPLIRSMNVHFDGLRSEGLAFITKAEAEKLKNVTVKEGDVLLNITGASIGRVTTVPGELAGARVNQHVCIIRPTAALHPKFLAYFFATPVEQMRINECQVGATRQALTKQMIEDWQVPLPPLEEQERVVAEIEKQFTRLEVGLAALRRVQANLKRYRAAVLAAACDGRLVTGDTRKWKQTTLEDVCAKVTDGDHQPPPKVPDGIPLLTIGNISSGRLDFSDTRFVPKEYFSRIKADRIPQSNDVLYSVVGATIGIPVLVTTERHFCFQRHIALLKPSAAILPKFLWLFMASPKTFREAWANTTGSAQPTLPLKALRGLNIALPPLAEQTRIVAEVERRLSVVEELDAVVATNLQRAKRLRGSILAAGFRSERNADQRPRQAKVKPAPRRQTDKPLRQVISPMKKNLKLSPESLVETVTRNKGRMTPAELCLASHIEEEVEGFFEVLRECRNRGLLVVPSGIGGIIKLGKS